VNGAFQPLFGARSLAEWIRAGGRPERRVPAYFLRLWWHAYFFEHNWKTQTSRISGGTLSDDPVFIIGLWRSGTTVFHELLTRLSGWRTPQTWQCFNPSTCFLSAPPSVNQSIDRPMDRGQIATLGPQEDEFALLLLGEPSLYRAFIDPRRLRECAEELWSPDSAATNRNPLVRWQGFLRGLTANETSTPLLLKSPSHTFRLPLLRRIFPRAKFVWVGRQIGEVLASNLRMWHTMVDSHGLWSCSPAVLQSFLRDMLDACAGVLTQCLDDMPRENMIWVDFQDLRDDRVQALQRVVRFLGVPGLTDTSAIAQRVAETLASVPIYEGSRVNPPEDESALRLEKLMDAARQRFR
jgi:omega-hydroxy-beta-dihydromenaquinone-9 sulfotransferase